MDVLQPTCTHRDHAGKWTITGCDSNLQMCIACMLELLEDVNIVATKKKFILSEFLNFISANMDGIISVLEQDEQVAYHICTILYGLTSYEDDLLVTVAIEGLVLVVRNLKIEELVCGVIDAVVSQSINDCNYSKSLCGFFIVEKLLKNIEGLSAYLLDKKDPFVEYLCSGISYPSEPVQNATLAILTSLCSTGELPHSLHKLLCQEVINVLNTASTLDTSTHVLRLLKKMINNSQLLTTLMATNGEGATLPSSLKKLLVSKHPVVQIAATQCVAYIISKHEAYLEILLQVDVAEFLFEGLASTNELLVRSIFCCLIVFTDSWTFFSKCHAVYGIDSILRSLEQAFKEHSPQTIVHGMSLLSILLEKHQSADVKLLNTAFKGKTCMKLIAQGIHHLSQHVILASCNAMANYLSVDHLQSGMPLGDIKSTVLYLAEKFKNEKLHRLTAISKSKASKHNSARRERCLLYADKLFKVLHLICKLFIGDNNQMLISEQAFSMPEEDQDRCDDIQADMYNYIIMVMDEICIPFILNNFNEIPLETIFINFYQVLNGVVAKSSPEIQELLIKLCESGVISTTLQIKSRFRNSVLTNCVCRVLACLVNVTLQDDMALPEVTDTILIGEKYLEGSLEESSNILEQHVTDVDTSTVAAQTSLVLLLYTSFYHGNSFIQESHLRERLCIFITQHQPLKLHLIKPVLFLLSLALPNVIEWSDVVRNALHIVCRTIVNCGHPSQWYIHHASVLKLVFRCTDIQAVCGREMLEMWMDVEKLSDSGSPVDLELELLIVNNEVCYQSLLDLASVGMEKASRAAVNVMKSVLEKYSSGMQPRQESILNALNKAFIAKSAGMGKCNINGLLELLVLVLQKSPSVDTSSYIMVLYHVINMIINKDMNDVKTTTNFITCLLSWDIIKASSTVSSLILGKSELLSMIDEWITTREDPFYTCALNMLALLVHLQAKHSIKVDYCIEIKTESLLKHFKSNHCILELVAINLWTAIFECGQTLVRLIAKECAVSSTQLRFPLTSEKVQLLLIYIQQRIMQVDPLMQQASVNCFLALHQSLRKENPQMALLILTQPWNRFLVATSIQCHEEWPRWLWQMVVMIVSYGASVLTEEDLDSLVQYLLEDNSTQNASLKTATVQKLLSSTHKHNQALKTKYQSLEHIQRKCIGYHLSNIEGIIVCMMQVENEEKDS